MIEVRAEAAEILLSGIVGDGWDENPITHKGVSEALKSFGSSDVTVHINSPGGFADEGIAIYNTLRKHPGEVTTINDSLAASAASVIFLAGQNRLMADGSRVMIHRALSFVMGNQDDFAKTINSLKAYDASMIDIYSKYMSGDSQAIEKLMADETWYNVDEAIASGLATGRVENGKKYRKPKNTFDAAAAMLARQKMAQFAKHLTSQNR